MLVSLSQVEFRIPTRTVLQLTVGLDITIRIVFKIFREFWNI